jgi:hypothetical protein
MRHLCLISLIWALALSLPDYLINNKQLNLAIAQQENIKRQLELKQVEQQFLNKLLIPESKQNKDPEASFKLF